MDNKVLYVVIAVAIIAVLVVGAVIVLGGNSDKPRYDLTMDEILDADKYAVQMITHCESTAEGPSIGVGQSVEADTVKNIEKLVIGDWLYKTNLFAFKVYDIEDGYCEMLVTSGQCFIDGKLVMANTTFKVNLNQDTVVELTDIGFNRIFTIRYNGEK
ncbi:MAG: hypothetical protein IJ593_10000 [Lachnospiraceae bacterium]|nr:hypothetical protein [Lachnospiraceae bacterium]